MITLYDWELSAECYQARLALGVLGLDHERVDVELYPSKQHESAAFRELSPLGRLPVLHDGRIRLDDPAAIAVYLAARYDATGRWYPVEDAALLGDVNAWLGFAREFAATSGAARLEASFGLAGTQPGDIDRLRTTAHRQLRVLDDHLWFAEQVGQEWLCAAATPTIADLVLFPDVALSEEGGVERQDYPAVRRWTDRVKRIPGFVEMSGVFPAGRG